ncbi:MAG TPA: peptidylprolyl isomerase [Sedimentisphaerales bacterium]|nr:peptidylprolyl isomerase [Sedimentisphaerales bacterium]HQI26449.1 peptidylprolyl isomerase [Sedimentisphaerales bacterium]
MGSVCFGMFRLYGVLGICIPCLAGLLLAEEKAPDRMVVAVIGDVSISRDELAQRLLQELRSHEEPFYQEPPSPSVESVLRKMLAEKATSLEGRKLGLDQDEHIRRAVSQLEQARLVGRLLETELAPKLKVEEADVDRAMKSRPNLTRDQARMMAMQAQANQLRDQYYAQVAAKRKITKVSENVAKTAQIHQRLLTQPRQPRGPTQYWILNSQLNTDLSDEERNLVLATFDGGQFTLKDWFQLLCDFPPPRRPQDLGKPEGVERLLDMGLRGPVLAAEARSRGYDQDPALKSELRRLEDDRLLYRTQEEWIQHIPEPTPEQVKARFDENPWQFATNPSLKADQIWCPDKETAQKIRTLLDQGTDFQTLRQEYSLQKDVSPYHLSPGSEGVFWAHFAKAEPNQLIGPIPGFYEAGAKWRLVKVLEFTPARTQDYSEELAGSAKWMLFGQQRRQALSEREKRLLEKYPHEIFFDRIRDLDPVEILLNQQDR